MAATAILAVAIGCSSGSAGEDPHAADRPEAGVDEWSDEDVIEVVGQYVAALATGDAAEADSLRCEDQQFGSERHDLFVAMSEYVAADLDGLALADADVVMSGDDGWTVSALLEGSDSPVNVLVLPEGGSVKVCGQSSPNGRDVRSALSEVEVATIPWTASTEDALGCGGVAGATSVTSDVPKSQPGDDYRGVVGRWSSTGKTATS